MTMDDLAIVRARLSELWRRIERLEAMLQGYVPPIETVGDRLSRLEGGDPAQDPSGIPSVCRPGRDEEELAALRW